MCYRSLADIGVKANFSCCVVVLVVVVVVGFVVVHRCSSCGEKWLLWESKWAIYMDM